MEKPVRGLFRHHTRVRTFQSHMDKVTVSSRRSCFVIVLAENAFLMTEFTKALKPARTRTNAQDNSFAVSPILVLWLRFSRDLTTGVPTHPNKHLIKQGARALYSPCLLQLRF
jgi:hypothetical protein